MGDITLTSQAVNSGTAISMQGATVKYTFKPLTRVTPNTGSFSLIEAQTAGFENPRIILTGYINTNKILSNSITLPLLQELSKIEYDGTDNTKLELKVTVGDTPVYLTGAESAIAWTTSQSIRVIVENFTLGLDSGDSKNGHFIAYSLTLVETK